MPVILVQNLTKARRGVKQGGEMLAGFRDRGDEILLFPQKDALEPWAS